VLGEDHGAAAADAREDVVVSELTGEQELRSTLTGVRQALKEPPPRPRAEGDPLNEPQPARGVGVPKLRGGGDAQIGEAQEVLDGLKDRRERLRARKAERAPRPLCGGCVVCAV
jgi:hypothetical protein